MVDDTVSDGYTYSMCNEMKITLPMRKEYRILACICIVGLLVIMSDFFRMSLSAPTMIITYCFCAFTFYLAFRRISVSSSEIRVSLFGLSVRVIKRERLACIEMVKWHEEICLLFEFGKCEKFDKSGFASLDDYCALNCFRVIDYTVPKGSEDYVLSVLSSMYDIHEADI